MIKPIIRIALAAALLAGLSTTAPAQEWPQKSIRIIVAFGPGGGSDIVARIIGQSLQDRCDRSSWSRTSPAPRHARQRDGRAGRQGRATRSG